MSIETLQTAQGEITVAIVELTAEEQIEQGLFEDEADDAITANPRYRLARWNSRDRSALISHMIDTHNINAAWFWCECDAEGNQKGGLFGPFSNRAEALEDATAANK